MTNTQYPLGIDISRWNSNSELTKHPDFDQMVRGGVKFVAMRAGISWGYKDPTFDRNWGEARRVLLPRIAYHVPYFHQPVNSQSDHLLRIVDGGGVNWDNDRLALDLELAGGQSRNQITDVTCGMMERLKSITGRYPILYSRANWVNTYMLMNELLKSADWWLAHYLAPLPAPQYTPEKKCPPLLPKGVSNWLIHQTGEKGNGGAVGTVSYYVDQNRFNGTREELDAYFGRGTNNVYLPIITNPEPEPVEDDWTGLLKVKLWSQHDPRWSNDRMGSSGVLMKHQGCLVTNVANYLDYLGVDTDPKRYNNLLGLKGGYQYNYVGGIKYANMYWKYPGVLFPQIQRELTDYTWYWNGTGWESQARKILNSKRPVLGLVDMYAGGELNQHWVLMVGERADGWWAVDPETGTLINLSKYGNKVYRIVGYRRLQ